MIILFYFLCEFKKIKSKQNKCSEFSIWALENQEFVQEKMIICKSKVDKDVYETPYYQSEDVFSWIMLQIIQNWPPKCAKFFEKRAMFTKSGACRKKTQNSVNFRNF